MDSVTQIVLGAAVAESCVGRRIGRRASLYGAVVATLPDLDVFVPLGGVVEDFIYHRSATHSLLMMSLVTPLIAWLVQRLHAPPTVSFKRWCATIWLVLVTHALLDAFTIYGTQLLWPISDYPFGLGSVFIIDPLYTVPMALGVLALLLLDRQRKMGRVLNLTGMVLSTCYLLFGVVAQHQVHARALRSLEAQNIAYRKVETLASPFTSLAWRIIVVADNAYYVAYHSLIAPAEQLRLQQWVREPDLLHELQDVLLIQHLLRFTKGSYTVEQKGDDILLSDLRMGIEPDRYAFTFVVAQQQGDKIVPVMPTRVLSRRTHKDDFERLQVMWNGAARL